MNGTAISGATSASYTTLPTTTSDNGGQFVVVVRNPAGSVTSDAPTPTGNLQRVALTGNLGGAGGRSVGFADGPIGCPGTRTRLHDTGRVGTLTATAASSSP